MDAEGPGFQKCGHGQMVPDHVKHRIWPDFDNETSQARFRVMFKIVSGTEPQPIKWDPNR